MSFKHVLFYSYIVPLFIQCVFKPETCNISHFHTPASTMVYKSRAHSVGSKKIPSTKRGKADDVHSFFKCNKYSVTHSHWLPPLLPFHTISLISHLSISLFFSPMNACITILLTTQQQHDEPGTFKTSQHSDGLSKRLKLL